VSKEEKSEIRRSEIPEVFFFCCSLCGDAFPIEGVLVATYLLSVEALPHCRCGVANKGCMV